MKRTLLLLADDDSRIMRSAWREWCKLFMERQQRQLCQQGEHEQLIALASMVAVVALVVPILILARSIGQRAATINGHLEETVENTDALKELNTTIDAAGAITAGLNRGRKRLGG